MMGVDLGMPPDWRVPAGKEIHMKEALERSVELFRAKEWKFEVDEESNLARTGSEGDNGHWQVMAIDWDDDDVLMLSLFPQKCSADRVANVQLLTPNQFGRLAPPKRRVISASFPFRHRQRECYSCPTFQAAHLPDRNRFQQHPCHSGVATGAS
jgi:hypothetical protein